MLRTAQQFEEALAHYKAGARIVPPNEQDFRHGWNAALEAAARRMEEARATWRPETLDYPGIVRNMDVEVQT